MSGTPGQQPPAGRSTEEALALFDRLPPVSPEAMLGLWQGESLASGHPLDGLLERFHWYGKAFHSTEDVDPLLFRSTGGGLVKVRALMPDPIWLQRFPWLGSRAAGDGFQRWLLPLLRIQHPQARLRSIEHRGVVSAAMVYDRLPIIDVFRRLDDRSLLGLMDLRGAPQPFFFVLRRAEPETSR